MGEGGSTSGYAVYEHRLQRRISHAVHNLNPQYYRSRMLQCSLPFPILPRPLSLLTEGCNHQLGHLATRVLGRRRVNHRMV